MQSNNRSNPSEWFAPWKELKSAELNADEKIAMLMHFRVDNKEEGYTAHTMFLVVEKGDHAIARSIIVHAKEDGYNNGTAHDLAKYPKQDIKSLIEELKEEALSMASRLATEGGKLTIDTSLPIKLLVPKILMTNKELAADLEGSNSPMTDEEQQILVKVLGLKKTHPTIKSVPNSNMVITMKVQSNDELTKMTLAEKQAQEKDLIKRFGKKKMEELAKTINYKGALINK